MWDLDDGSNFVHKQHLGKHKVSIRDGNKLGLGQYQSTKRQEPNDKNDIGFRSVRVSSNSSLRMWKADLW